MSLGQPHLVAIVERESPEDGVDEILAAVLAEPHSLLVADHDVNAEVERSTPPLRVLEPMLGDVGALAVLPALALARAEPQRRDDGEGLLGEVAERLVAVELPVEVEAADLDAGGSGVP